MAQRFLDPTTLTSYGVSRQRSSFTFVAGTGEIASDGAISGGMLQCLLQDLTTDWTMYNGNPIAGNELVDNTITAPVTFISKQFFSQLSLNRSSGNGPYAGVANFSEHTPDAPSQHVAVLESLDPILPKSGAVSRGIDQKFRIRFEFDLRPRLYFNLSTSVGDKEFSAELYQLNLRQNAAGRSQYISGNTIDESIFRPDLYHPGYTFNGTLASGWEDSTGIPNPMYGWLKVSTGTSSQIKNDGTVTNSQVSTDGLITLENGSTLETSVIRYPGECVDVKFEDVTIAADPANSGPYYVYGTESDTSTYGTGKAYYYPVYLDQAAANAADTTAGGTGTSHTHTFNEYPLATFYMPTTGANHAQITAPSGTSYTQYINNRSLRFRNKRKGPGWWKRFPKTDASLAGTYPFSYRFTITERGLIFYIYDDAAADQADDYAWFALQRTVNNQTGLPRTDEASKFPLHCMYSCSREAVYSTDSGVYFSQSAANLQTVENTISTVFDESGTQYDISNLDNSKTFYILSPYDREDYLASDYQAKNIWRFVAREFDILKPSDAHFYATRHQVDSNAVINPLEQLAITDENRFVITFPTGLTTQRFMYPKEEVDLICFSSAEVVAESSNVPMTTYFYDGTNADNRRYQGMRSTAAFGNGMRILLLVNSQYIFNTDVNLDTYDAVGAAS